MLPAEAGAWATELVATYPDKHFVVLGNKIDMRSEAITDEWTFATPLLPISAKSGIGMSELTTWLVAQITQDFNSGQETIVTNLRHLEALQRTETALLAAKNGVTTNITGDFIAMDIRQAMYNLGTITGDISTEDLLGNIFSKFCIGK
jgi:tRNA modification GTPase